MNTRKVGIGLVLLVASTVLILITGQVSNTLPPLIASIAALGLAAGTLLVGTSDDARAV